MHAEKQHEADNEDSHGRALLNRDGAEFSGAFDARAPSVGGYALKSRAA